ncbi:MAG: SDR family NAD(P)-dependent oxidoreductase [Candidatus Heimdallarchaeota archaeon]
MKKILVTGGCGFIGSNIVQRLVKEGYDVKVIDDLSAGSKDNIKDCLENEKCEFRKGSILDKKLLQEEFKGIDVVIHEAANPDVRTSKDNIYPDFEVNVLGTVNILIAMANENIPKIIFASSGGTVYGETKVIPTPETAPFSPISHYGASKAAAEQYLSSFASLFDIEAISLRLGNIFGPPSNHGVMHDFYWKLKENPKELLILGDGKQTKSYLFVDDCVDAHILALKTKVNGHVAFNIATETGLTVNEIADNVAASMGLTDVTYKYTGGERGWEGDVRKAIVDITKAKEILNWKPNTTVKDGIQKYIDWIKSKY